MYKFTALSDGVIPLNLDNVDTDMIIPAQHLTSISRDGYKDGLFSNLRADDDFIFNNPQYNQHRILVSKHNFGCGSSREHAVWALQEYGIQVVICCSFSDIFYNNAAKNGLLLIQLDEQLISTILQNASENPSFTLQVSLVEQSVTYGEHKFNFAYDKFRKHCLLYGLNDLDCLMSKQQEIDKYEQTHCNTGR